MLKSIWKFLKEIIVNLKNYPAMFSNVIKSKQDFAFLEVW